MLVDLRVVVREPTNSAGLTALEIVLMVFRILVQVHRTSESMRRKAHRLSTERGLKFNGHLLAWWL